MTDHAPLTDEQIATKATMLANARRHGMSEQALLVLAEELLSEVRRARAAASPAPAEAAPCGGSRCWQTPDGKSWVHSSKSYDSCAFNRGEPGSAA